MKLKNKGCFYWQVSEKEKEEEESREEKEKKGCFYWRVSETEKQKDAFNDGLVKEKNEAEEKKIFLLTGYWNRMDSSV